MTDEPSHEGRMPEEWREDIPDETVDFLDDLEEASDTMPPNPNNVEDTIDLSEDWRQPEERATIDYYTNSACAIGRDREDATEGVWLDRHEKRALYEALEDHFDD